MSNGMDRLAEKVKKQTDDSMMDREKQVLTVTAVDLEAFRLQVSDQESFDKLIKAVKEATVHNENLAQLKDRLSALGAGVLDVAKEVGLRLPL